MLFALHNVIRSLFASDSLTHAPSFHISGNLLSLSSMKPDEADVFNSIPGTLKIYRVRSSTSDMPWYFGAVFSARVDFFRMIA
jgi:hypothetical protein